MGCPHHHLQQPIRWHQRGPLVCVDCGQDGLPLPVESTPPLQCGATDDLSRSAAYNPDDITAGSALSNSCGRYFGKSMEGVAVRCGTARAGGTTDEDIRDQIRQELQNDPHCWD